MAVAHPPARARRVLVAKSNRTFAETLSGVCQEVFPDAEVKICVGGGETLALLKYWPVDFLVLGLSFPDADGLELLQLVRVNKLATHILVVSGRLDEPRLPALHTARVDAIIHTVEEPVSALKHALLMVDQGQVYVSPSLRELLVESHPAQRLRQELTVAELRVLRVIGTGSDNQEAAQVLTLSEATVQTHRRNIMRKLKVSTSAKLVREAVRLGIVHISIVGAALPGGLSSIIDRLSDA